MPEAPIPVQPVEDPILCSPYEKPDAHWLYDTRTGVPSKAPGRRPASYWYKNERTGSAQLDLLAEEERDDLPLVNALRADVERWRDSGWRGASETTKRLLRHWRRADRPRRLFFCQLEAVETVVYLREMLARGRTPRRKPEAIYRRAEDALITLAGEWKRKLEQARRAAPGQDRTPPVRIVVCDNTDVATHLHRMISGEERVAPDADGAPDDDPDDGASAPRKTAKRPKPVRRYGSGLTGFPELWNREGETVTLRIDSKLLEAAESGDPAATRTEAAEELRRTVATVGRPGEPPPPDLPKHEVLALPERRAFEIRFPVGGGGYVARLTRHRIACDVQAVEPLRLDPWRVPTAAFVRPQVGHQVGRPGAHGGFRFEMVDRQEYYDSTHPQAIAFEIACEITSRLTADDRSGAGPAGGAARAALFPQVLAVVEAYVPGLPRPSAQRARDHGRAGDQGRPGP